MASFTAGTTFSDGVANDVTAAKLGALVTNATPTSGLIQDRTAETVVASNDTVLIGDASDSNNLKRMTVDNLMKADMTGNINSTSGTIQTLTSSTATITSGTFSGSVNSTTGTIGSLTTGTGTAASPAIVSTGDTNNGLFFPAADNIAVSTNGTERVRVDSSGNVGIGVTSPTGKLHVNGQTYIQGTVSGGLASSTLIANASGQAQFWGLGPDVSTTGSMAFVVSRSNLASSVQALTIDSSGRVGIGTSSPSESLEVSGSAPKIKISATSNSSVQLLFNSNASGVQKDTGSIYYLNNEAMTFQTQSTERLRIDSSGNVGIGVTSPTGIGSNYTTLDIRGSSGGGVGLGSTSAGQFAQIYAVNLDSSLRIQNTSASGFTNFTTNNTERLRIDSSGNVGIGVTAPVNKLEVVGSFGRGAPVTKTGDFTLADTENWLIVNKGSSCTVTLPAASSWTGREFTIKVITAHAVISASSNVVPRNSATAGTAILTNVAGSWATLVSNGTNWVIMCGS